MSPTPLPEQLIALIEASNEFALINFLKTLTDKDKKQLAPQLKKLLKEYDEFGPMEGILGPFGHKTMGYLKGTDAQRELLKKTAFACLSRTEFTRIAGRWWFSPEKVASILDWYCPAWFSDYLNDKDASIFSNYHWVVEMMEKGQIQPSKELIVRMLPASINVPDKNPREIDAQRLSKYPVTLREHIWYLFELESSLNFIDRWGIVVEKEKGFWVTVFLQLSANGTLDRRRLLQESLLASNRNFTKPLSAWFASLFVELAPAKTELLGLQKELITVLSSPQSKPISVALQAMKQIVTEPEFAAEGFLDTVPLLLAANTKSTLTNCLMLLEKLAQKNSGYRQRIVLGVCQCFISKEEEVQTRAAKLIGKFGAADDEALRQEIGGFRESLLSAARTLLAPWLTAGGAAAEIEGSVTNGEDTRTGAPAAPSGDTRAEAAYATGDPAPQPRQWNPIATPATLDDLVFLASQAFDNNEPWHLDVLAAALIQFAPRLKKEDLPLLEPAFQRALGLTHNEFRSNNGQLDHLLAFFFIDFGNWLVRKFPESNQGILEIYKKFDTEQEGKKTSWLVVPQQGSYTSKWKRDIPIYDAYQQLLLVTLDRIRGGSNLPLLSTPAMAPCWIPATVLVQRLHHYQQSGQQPENMDLQIALSRCSWDDQNREGDRNAAVAQARDLLTGELRDLLVFLLDPQAAPGKPVQYRAAWMVASLTRADRKQWDALADLSYYEKPFNNYTGRLKWASTMETYTLDWDDWKIGKKRGQQHTRKALIVEREYPKPEGSIVGKLFSRLRPGKKDDPPMLYDFLRFRTEFGDSLSNDTRRILSLVPHNPEPVVAETIIHCLKRMGTEYENDRRTIVAVEQFLYETGLPPGEMTMVFLGTCLLHGDKTIINTAAELWLMAVSAGQLDNVRLGYVIAEHLRNEFAPLKRLTDVMSQSLFKVSALHDRALSVLVENILARLPEEPVKGVKKLQQLQKELQAL